MSDCKLLTINSLRPIEGADRIELASVGNYQTVVQKGTHSVGDQVVFVPADTVIPEDREWAQSFLEYAKKRVRVIKLKGVYSEGLVIPLDVAKHAAGEQVGLPNVWSAFSPPPFFPEEIDWDVALGVKHYEAPINPSMAGKMRGWGLPYGIPKTDCERWENVFRTNDSEEFFSGTYTYKIDGSSATYCLGADGELRVFSRRVELYTDDENVYTKIAKKYAVKDWLEDCNAVDYNVALRGEVYGSGIQAAKKNPHSNLPLDFAVFGVWDIDERTYLPFESYPFARLADYLIPTVTFFNTHFPISRLNSLVARQLAETLEDCEGAVFWTREGNPIKIISKQYEAAKK